MTMISFDATYDVSTLHKMKTAELRETWMKLCSPPALKDHLIRDILYFQKKNRSDELRLQNTSSTDQSTSDFRASMPDIGLTRRTLPRLEAFHKSEEIRKRTQSSITRKGAHSKSQITKTPRRKSRMSAKHDSKYHSSPLLENLQPSNFGSEESDFTKRKPQLAGGAKSYSTGFLKWITGNEKVDKKSEQGKDNIGRKKIRDKAVRQYGKKNDTAKHQTSTVNNPRSVRKSRANHRPNASIRDMSLQLMSGSSAQSQQSFMNVDIHLDGLGVIADKVKINNLQPQKSSEFYIKRPSSKVRIDKFKE